MLFTFDTPVPMADEANALAQALEEITVLRDALAELVPLDRQHPTPQHTFQFDFGYTPDRRLTSIFATARPEKLDS